MRPASIEDPAAAAAGVTRLVPQYDDLGLLVWSADFGDTSNFNTARLPFFARLDARVTFRPRWANDRWQFYFEVINLLNRDNASELEVDLVYDPNSDRPQLTEVRSGRSAAAADLRAAVSVLAADATTPNEDRAFGLAVYGLAGRTQNLRKSEDRKPVRP